MGLTVKINARLAVKAENGQKGMLDILAALAAMIRHNGSFDEIKICDKPIIDTVECLIETQANNVRAKELLSRGLLDLFAKDSITMEIWTSCGEIGYDEHIYVENSRIVIEEEMETLSLEDFDNGVEETEEQKAWNERWGTWIENAPTSPIDDCGDDAPF